MFIFTFIINSGEKITRSTAEAFAAFYEQYMPKVFRYLCYRVTNETLAEDLTSVVFEKALTRFKSYSSEKASFATWVFTIARNTLIDHFRVSSKETQLQTEDTLDCPENAVSPEEAVIADEERRVLQHCITRLSRQEQELISLKFGADMTNRQIAGMLGLSDSNVGVMLYRAVRKLRNDFEGWHHGK